MCVLYAYAQIICRWHLDMQITCDQCLDAICRENHQHRLSHKSFIWSWNGTTQHFLWQILFNNPFLSHWKDSLENWVVDDRIYKEYYKQCVDDVSTFRWHVDDVCHQPTKSLYDMYMCGQHLNSIDNMHFVYTMCRKWIIHDRICKEYSR